MTAAQGHRAFLDVPDADAGSTDQTGFVLHRLVETSTRPFEFSLNANEPAQNATGLASTAPVVMTHRRDGLAQWSGGFTAYYPKSAPGSGHLGNITFSGGNTNRVSGYTLNLTCAAFDVTGFGSTAPTWREFVPDLWTGTGTYTARVPTGSTPALVGTTATATFRLTTDDTDNTIAVPISITDFALGATIGELQEITYSFQVNGDATSAGTNSLLATGGLVRPEETEVNFYTVASSQGYNGRCFITALDITVNIGESVTVAGSLQGTGELATAS